MKRKSKKIFLILSTLLMTLFLLDVSFAITTELVSTNPSPVIAGDYADITLRFTNLMDSSSENIIRNLQFNIKETKYIQPVDKDESISQIQPGESITRTFRVYFSDKLEEGYINLPIEITYSNIVITKDIKIFIEDSKREPELFIGKVESIPNEILRDSDNNKLEITLQNLGDKTAELVKAELITLSDEISPSYSYSFEDAISSIDGGKEGQIKFTIDVDENVNSDLIPAKLKLRYRSQKSTGNSYDIFEKTLNFSIPITPAPYLVIDKVEQLSDFKIGTADNKLRVQIKNEGSVPAEEVRVRIVPDISYPFIFEETTQYVSAKIQPGETADVIYNVEVTKDGEVKNYKSIAVLETLVEDSRYSREDTISIKTSKGRKTDNSDFAYIIVGAVVFVSIALGINTYKQRV